MVVGVRLGRSSPLIWATWSEGVLRQGELVVVRLGEPSGPEPSLGWVVVPADLVLDVPPEAVTATVIAAGGAAPLVVEALRARDRATLSLVRAEAGPDLPVDGAIWNLDQARLTVVTEASDVARLAALRERLAARFRAEVVFRGRDGDRLALPG